MSLYQETMDPLLSIILVFVHGPSGFDEVIECVLHSSYGQCDDACCFAVLFVLQSNNTAHPCKWLLPFFIGRCCREVAMILLQLPLNSRSRVICPPLLGLLLKYNLLQV